MNETLSKYIPEHAVKPVFDLIVANQVHLKIVNERQTRHGDYRKGPSGKHEITVNASLNKYRFLLALRQQALQVLLLCFGYILCTLVFLYHLMRSFAPLLLLQTLDKHGLHLR